MPRKPWCELLLPAVLISAPAAAQERPGVVGELLRDLTVAEGKVIALAKALPSSAYDWRPAPGVRSTAQVFVHIAGDNYFLPALTVLLSGSCARAFRPAV
jgi:hypothetical protein